MNSVSEAQHYLIELSGSFGVAFMFQVLWCLIEILLLLFVPYLITQ
jgi:hypothetical protein